MSDPKKLAKSLKLFDVYAICTGAMFSSGFFLLPGIAASVTGPSVYLAYLFAGVLILPAMLSAAELSTAMPKAGGAYYFLDRSLGPLMGTVGGLGSWIALVFKSAFALVGMGAYLAIFIDLPVTSLAVALTIVFGFVNIFGAKETTFLQRVLVTTLVVIMGYFCLEGLTHIGVMAPFKIPAGEDQFFTGGFEGFLATIGLVFVSFAGLTKVASVAEEVQNPDRNIPLGMFLSLLTATLIYVVGVIVMMQVIPIQEFYESLTPVADASEGFFGWLPENWGLFLIVIAASAAFASTGNAGIMAASRYPFAMAKDKLLPLKFTKLSKFQTPAFAIMVTSGCMVAILILFDIEAVAKLASAFQLLLFGLINLAVIVMREAKIETYRPGFYSPFYPWVQIAGIIISLLLILEMGTLAIAFTGFLCIFCAVWYYYYAFGRVKREGAIYHVHARLGKRRFEGLEQELDGIQHERDNEKIVYQGVLARSEILDVKNPDIGLQDLLDRASEILSKKLGREKEEVFNKFASEGHSSYRTLADSVFLNDVFLDGIEQPEIVVFRVDKSISINISTNNQPAYKVVFLAIPSGSTGLDTRLANHISEIVSTQDFLENWVEAQDEKRLRNLLLNEEYYLFDYVKDIPALLNQVDKEIAHIELPEGVSVQMIERNNRFIIATPKEKLQNTDKVIIVGESKDLKALKA